MISARANALTVHVEDGERRAVWRLVGIHARVDVVAANNVRQNENVASA